MNVKIRQAAVEVLEGRRLLAANLVSDAAGLYPTDAVRAGRSDYFFANDGTHGRELWTSGPAGTKLAADITEGAKGTEAEGMAAVGDGVIFLTKTQGRKVGGVQQFNYTVWSSDGTQDGTAAIASFANVGGVTTQSLGGKAVFSVYTSNADRSQESAVWGTDGTTAGTTKLQTYAVPDGFSAYITEFFDLGNRTAYRVNEQLWGTDGTEAGTVNLTPLFGFGNSVSFDGTQYATDGDDRLVAISNDGLRLVTTDGTAAGTVAKAIDANGRLDYLSSRQAVVSGQMFVVSVNSDGNDIVKNVYGVNIDTGELTPVYAPPGRDDSGHHIQIDNISTGVSITDIGDGKISRIVSDGTAAGTRVVEADVGGNILATAEADGVVYSLRLIRSYSDDNGGTFVVRRQGDDAGLMITGGGSESRVELWRSDGTAAGTVKVKTVQENNKAGQLNVYTLSAANGKIVLRTENGTYTPPAKGTGTTFADILDGLTSDDTAVYDGSELQARREAVVARLVNGTLRIGGSANDDDILVYRRASDPEQLVVEYNGNTRVFKTGDVTRIKADLQDGKDRFELREGDEGFLRLRTSVSGGDGNDTIITASGRDTITGGSGSDKIYAGRGADQVNGGAGGDRINGQSGNDRINGGSGRDRITSGGGADVLFGMSAVEMAFGTNAEGQSYADDVLLT